MIIANLMVVITLMGTRVGRELVKVRMDRRENSLWKTVMVWRGGEGEKYKKICR